MNTSHILIDPDIAGGKPHISGHRITVHNIAIRHERLGKSVEEICTELDLSLSEVHAALSYYFDHQQEIDSSIEQSNEYVKQLRESTPSILAEKLKKSRSA